MKSTLLNEIERILIIAGNFEFVESQITIKYFQHKDNSADIIKSIDEAYERGLDLSKYNKVEYTTTKRAELQDAIAGKGCWKIGANPDNFKRFADLLQKLSSPKEERNTRKHKREGTEPKDSPFNIEKSKAAQTLANAKRGVGKLSEQEAFDKLMEVYTKYGKTYTPKPKAIKVPEPVEMYASDPTTGKGKMVMVNPDTRKIIE